ncbi:hypothetical protein BHM03_00054012, partial [Ensete ventricosum]
VYNIAVKVSTCHFYESFGRTFTEHRGKDHGAEVADTMELLWPAASGQGCNVDRRVSASGLGKWLQSEVSKKGLKDTWPSISLTLFGAGFFLGPLLDGLHSRVNLMIYQNGAVDVGPLHTNIWLLLDEKAPSRSKVGVGSVEKTAISLMYAVSAVCFPLCLRLFHLWNYPGADVQLFGEGLVSWTSTCYFVYTPFLTNLARWLKSATAEAEDSDQVVQ